MPVPLHHLDHYSDPTIATWLREAPTPADDPHARIAIVSPELLAIADLGSLVLSWAAETPEGSFVVLQLRLLTTMDWSGWYQMARWDSAPPAQSQRASLPEQSDEVARLATDTLIVLQASRAVQIRVLLCAAPGADMPEISALSLLQRDRQRWITSDGAPAQVARRVERIELPYHYAQFSYPGGAGWCSPTSLAMVLAYWHAKTGDPRLAPFTSSTSVPDLAAPMVYDPVYEGTGNWPFNTAYAASLGLTAYVAALHNLDEVLAWCAAGVPLIFSLAWEVGELDHTPITRSSGHLLVITGGEEEKIFVADPAVADPSLVARSYRADQLFACWQRNSAGIVYVIHPPAWPVPQIAA